MSTAEYQSHPLRGVWIEMLAVVAFAVNRCYSTCLGRSARIWLSHSARSVWIEIEEFDRLNKLF